MRINNIFKLSFVFVLSLFLLFMVGCDNQEINPELVISGEENICIGQKAYLDVEIKNGVKNNTKLTWESENESVATVENGVVTAISQGSAKITVKYMGKYSNSITINVGDVINSVSFVEGYKELNVGDTYETKIKVVPENSNATFEYVSSDTNVATIDDKGKVTVKGYGEAVISVRATTASNISAIMLVSIIDDVAPTVTFKDAQDIRVGWNQPWDPLGDIVVTDNADGDITKNVEVILNEVEKQYYGPCSVVYSATDKAGNKLVFSRTVDIYWPYQTTVIGHGLSYYGIMNTEEAALNAIHYMHYPMLEVDVHITSDGVFVCSHDATFGEYKISTTPYSVLKDVELTGERGSGLPVKYGLTTHKTYTYHIYKFEDLLDLCKEYHTMLKIELKAAFSANEMKQLMTLIENRDMLDLITFTAGSSQKSCLIWLRDNGYTNEIQYLAWTCESQSTLDFCIKYNINVSICVTYGNYANSDEWIKKYKDAGLKLSCFTFQYSEDYSVVQKWVDKGADYVTCDWHDPKALKLKLADK